jgi:hypothetical protein
MVSRAPCREKKSRELESQTVEILRSWSIRRLDRASVATRPLSRLQVRGWVPATVRLTSAFIRDAVRSGGARLHLQAERRRHLAADPVHQEPRAWFPTGRVIRSAARISPIRRPARTDLDTRDREDREDDAAADPADEREQRQHTRRALAGGRRIEKSGRGIRHAREDKPRDIVGLPAYDICDYGTISYMEAQERHDPVSGRCLDAPRSLV